MAFPLISTHSLLDHTRRILRNIFLGEDDSSRLSQLIKRVPRREEPAPAPPASLSQLIKDTPPPRAPAPAPAPAARPQQGPGVRPGWGTQDDLRRMAKQAQQAVPQRTPAPKFPSDLARLLKAPGHAPSDQPIVLPSEPAKPAKPERHMVRKAREAAERERAAREFHPPSHYGAFPHEEPAAHLPHGDLDKQDQEFTGAVHHPDAAYEKAHYHGGGIMPTFEVQYRKGPRTILKLPGGDQDPEQRGPRHRAIHRMLAHMGYGHMATPGDNVQHPDVTTTGPGVDQEFRRKADKHRRAGVGAFATKMADLGNDGGQLANFSRDFVEKNIDPKEILHMALTDALADKKDGHGGNYLVTQKNPKTGKHHLVSIDHDWTFNYGGGGGGGIRSQALSPHGRIYYKNHIKKIPGYENGEIGTNYPPRVRKLLEWLSKGGHRDANKGLGLRDDDADTLQKTAQSMLTKGFEEHLRGKYISP